MSETQTLAESREARWAHHPPLERTSAGTSHYQGHEALSQTARGESWRSAVFRSQTGLRGFGSRSAINSRRAAATEYAGYKAYPERTPLKAMSLMQHRSGHRLAETEAILLAEFLHSPDRFRASGSIARPVRKRFDRRIDKLVDGTDYAQSNRLANGFFLLGCKRNRHSPSD